MARTNSLPRIADADSVNPDTQHDGRRLQHALFDTLSDVEPAAFSDTVTRRGCASADLSSTGTSTTRLTSPTGAIGQHAPMASPHLWRGSDVDPAQVRDFVRAR